MRSSDTTSSASGSPTLQNPGEQEIRRRRGPRHASEMMPRPRTNPRSRKKTLAEDVHLLRPRHHASRVRLPAAKSAPPQRSPSLQPQSLVSHSSAAPVLLPSSPRIAGACGEPAATPESTNCAGTWQWQWGGEHGPGLSQAGIRYTQDQQQYMSMRTRQGRLSRSEEKLDSPPLSRRTQT